MSAANNGPKRFHYIRTVSSQMSMPRSNSRSSTLRNESGKRTYIMNTRRITSGEELKQRNGLGGLARDVRVIAPSSSAQPPEPHWSDRAVLTHRPEHPASIGVTSIAEDDFVFPQMTLDSCKDWSPGFPDYLYLSFTNATAFLPTDTMPLSDRAKMLMMAESAISLLTLALVAARAVNILN